MKNLIFILLAIGTLSCSSSETESPTCVDIMIDNLNMEHYNGEIEGECRNYLRWFTHNGNDYFMLDNPCADLVLHLWDCEKVDVCKDNSQDCQIPMSVLILY